MKSEKNVYRKDLIPLFAQRTGMTQKRAEEVMDTFLAIIKEYLCQKTAVHLTGFGIFQLRKDSARMGRNPKTMAPYLIKPGYKPEFKPSRSLWQDVNQNAAQCDSLSAATKDRH